MSKRAKTIYALAAVGVLGLFFYVFVSYLSDNAHPIIEKQPSVAMQTMYAGQVLKQQPISVRIANGEIIITLNELLEKKFVEFEYEAPTVTVPLLAYISPEGKVVTSFRYCEPCGSKDFSAEGMEMVCGNCGTRWSFVNLRGISGSCQKYPPAPFPSKLVGNEIRMDEKIVANWKIRS